MAYTENAEEGETLIFAGRYVVKMPTIEEVSAPPYIQPKVVNYKPHPRIAIHECARCRRDTTLTGGVHNGIWAGLPLCPDCLYAVQVESARVGPSEVKGE